VVAQNVKKVYICIRLTKQRTDGNITTRFLSSAG